MSSQITFGVNGLYILLSDRGDKSYTFHWGLYLHQAENSGYLYHLVNEADSTSWRFDQGPIKNIVNDQRLLGALKIGVLDPTVFGKSQSLIRLDSTNASPAGCGSKRHSSHWTTKAISSSLRA